MVQRYDVIIVGGGVAGNYLASLLEDADVLVIEKNKKVRPKDSGIVSRRIFTFFKKPPIKAEIREMELVSPSGITTSLRKKEPMAYILKRRQFTKMLRKMSKKNATVRYEEVKYIRYDDDGVRVETDRGVYYADIVVGADGTASIVRKSAGIKPPQTIAGLMVKTKKKMPGGIRVFFNKYYSPDYFSWIIPASGEYGLMTGIRPKSYLDYFTGKLQLPKGKLYAYLVPLGYTRSYAYRTLLVGDSCGQNKPLTGGGIIFSLTAARLAAETIGSVAMGKNFSSELGDYEVRWKRTFGLEIDKQFVARQVYRNLTNEEIDDMFKRFGPHVSRMADFDYDHISQAWRNMPKKDLAKLAVRKIPKALRR